MKSRKVDNKTDETTRSMKNMSEKRLKYRRVGWRILDRRLELGITREALSDRLGIDASVVDKIESGESDDLLVYVVAIGIELNIDLDSLFDYGKDPKILGNITNAVLKTYR